MANQLETTMDAPVATSDSSATASKALINEVNSSAKPNDIKPADQAQENKVNTTFGSLVIVGDESKDSAPAAKTTSDSATSSSPADAPATAVAATDKTAATLADAPATSVAATDSAPSTGNSAEKGAKALNGDGTPDVAKQPDASDINGQAFMKIQDDPQVKASKKTLEADITKQEKGLDKNSQEYIQLETMRQNMDTLEVRGATENPPLAPEEIAKTFKSASHLMEAKDGPNVLPHKDRVEVAQQLMLHAADPTTIDQGQHQTCNVSTVEARMFTKNPAAAASLIDQVATTGEYHTPGSPSETVKINPESLKHLSSDSEESKPIPLDGDRSYASQIFQVTAVNLSHQTHDLHVKDDKGIDHTYPKGTVEYRQEKPDENTTPPNPSGETLYDKSKNPPEPIKDDDGNVIHSPKMQDDHIIDTYNMITDNKESGFYVCNKDNIDGEGKEVTKISSEAELKQTIIDAQKNGKLPIILGVNSGEEPFYSDSKGGAAGGAGGGHVVTITGIDKDGKVMMDNQWGKGSKHSVDMHELYIATMSSSDAANELKKDCAQNAKDGKVDFATEAELLRLRHASGDLQGKDNEFRDQLIWLTKNAVKDADDNHGGQLDKRTETELQNLLAPQYSEKGREWKQISDQVWADPLRGIMNGSGNVGVDEMGQKRDLPVGYATGQMDRDAKSLFDAGDQTVYFNQDDYSKLDRALAYKSPAEIKQMDQEFKTAHNGQSMEDYIKDRFSRHPEEREKALKLLHAAQTGNDQAAA